MLLQDFFASARLHIVQKKIYYQKSGVYYLCHLKSNHIGQRKSTDKEKHLSMIDFV